METLEAPRVTDTNDWTGGRPLASNTLGAWTEIRSSKVLQLREVGDPAHVTSDPIAAAFAELAERWERETAIESFPHRRAMHPAYQQILAMGPVVIPLILDRLRQNADDWFWALRFLTGADPAEGLTRLDDAAAAWVAWGIEHGYIGRAA